MKVLTVLPTKAYLHAPEPLQPEALDSVEERLREMLADTARRASRGPPFPCYLGHALSLSLHPGSTSHPLPRLATVAGVVIATDAGTPGVKERKEARGWRLSRTRGQA